MRARANVLVGLLLFAASLAGPAEAQEPAYFTLSGGWAWPAGGPVEDGYEDGFTFAGSFRAPVAPNYLYGFEVGYTMLTLDSGKLGEAVPGTSFSGGDLGLLSVTTENDYILGSPDQNARPFVNLGMGYFASFIDEVTATTGSTTQSAPNPVYEGSFFGFHGGAGLLINRDRFGLRLDANYQYLFAGGEDLAFFNARGGIIFYPKER